MGLTKRTHGEAGKDGDGKTKTAIAEEDGMRNLGAVME